MEENIVSNLKLIFKPLVLYQGKWNLSDNLEQIALESKGKNAYQSFLERYYYMPLKVIFKDDELVKTFRFRISSRIGNTGRSLYFSKKEFLRNIISNIDELVLQSGETVYKEIKKAIREKKDIYRDVVSKKEESPYYEIVKKEYFSCDLDLTFEAFTLLCKKKYTRLLTGYNAVLEFFDKPLPIDKFISCFSIDQLYLLTLYSMKETVKTQPNLLESFIPYFEEYSKLIKEKREKEPFYTSHLELEGKDGKQVYTLDSFLKEYEEMVGKKNIK